MAALVEKEDFSAMITTQKRVLNMCFFSGKF